VGCSISGPPHQVRLFDLHFGALMIQRRSFTLFALLAAVPLSAQQVPQPATRAIRRDLPLTNTIRRAFAAGTRDSTGRPGRNYWQLWTDYTITARLEPATSTLSGRETIELRNASDSALSSIQMRLDQNIFRGDVPRGASTPAENHEGFVITRLAVNGATIDLGAPPAARAAYGSVASPGPFVAGYTRRRLASVSRRPSPRGPRRRSTSNGTINSPAEAARVTE
jgi:hypothetical protein